MLPARPLPEYLMKRYKGWKATTYAENAGWYRKLSDQGQQPRMMVISCCDSRVHINSMFGADHGDFFIHRNIANLVPPFVVDGERHGTSAAVEYAVTALKVSHLIILGHSSCGGVAGCYDMCVGQSPDLAQDTSFVGRWLDILRPGFDRLPDAPEADRRAQLEKEAVVISLENLMSFPFVKDAVAQEQLTLHGVWHHIGDGSLSVYDPQTQQFDVV